MIPNRLPKHAPYTLTQRSNFLPLTAKVYDAWRQRSLSLLTGEHYPLEREFQLMLDWLEVQPGQRYLDVGTSTGNYAIAIAKAGGIVTAIDIARPMLEQAQQRLEALPAPVRAAITLEQANVEALPSPDASVDGVVIGASLNEFHSTERAMAECARVLRPGGKLFMMYLCASETAMGQVVQGLFKLSGVRFPNRDALRHQLEQLSLHRTRAEVRRAVALEMYVKESRAPASSQRPDKALTRPIGKPQREPLGDGH